MIIKNSNKILWLIEAQLEIKPKSLCAFFWAMVLSVSTIPISYPTFIFNLITIKKKNLSTLPFWHGLLIIAASFAGESLLFAKKFKACLTFKSVLIWNPVGSIIVLLGVAAFIGIVYLLIMAAERIGEWHEKRLEKKYSEPKPSPKQPGIIRQYLKAKKDKVCPIIEYVD